MNTVWLQAPPHLGGEIKEVPATQEALVPLMVKGYRQVNPPKPAEEKEEENHVG